MQYRSRKTEPLRTAVGDPRGTIILDGVAYSLCGGRIFSCGLDANGKLLWGERRPESEACGKVYTVNTMRVFVRALHAKKRGASA